MCKKNKVADPSQPWSRGNLVKRKETYNNNESWRNQPSTKVPEKKNVDDSVEEAAEGNGVTCPGCNKYKITRCGDDHSSVHYWSSGKSKRICLSCKRNETIGQCSQCGEIRPLVLGKLFDSKMCGSCKEDKQRKRCASCHNVKVTGRESKHLVDKEGKPASICKACADKEGDMKKCGNPKCRKMAITTVRSKVHFEDGAAIQGKYICSTCHHHEKTGECPICKAHAPLDCTSIKHFNRETRLGVTVGHKFTYGLFNLHCVLDL
ncbi:hypothetical protein BT96DRAFT_971821 [Gymnopus androsaceus JB14]|uniref:Uncharacterized protein n=1 Tax=Gymnopus androsaceus JB14 TaxID=1447944 RepID=A0A6A4I9L7_9AGAR|nr:hypothetical protein BT96DRAFT_971821 [Gymnopus androsaceus JB14]